MLFSRALTRPIINNISKTQTRSTSAVVGVPTKKYSSIETAVLGSIMVSSFLATPVWVLLHLREYRGIDKEAAADD